MTALKQRNPIATIDERVAFNEPTHTYFLDGRAVPISVTSVVGRLFSEFDPDETLVLYYERWKSSGSSKYEDVISSSATDDEAKAAIKLQWEAAGRQASELGTRIHAAAELALNGGVPSGDAIKDVEREFSAFQSWFSEFALPNKLTAFRTELAVFLASGDGTPLLAGMIDALFVDADGRHWLIDWKRTKAPFGPSERSYGRKGFGAACKLPETKFLRFSLQLAIYACLLKHTLHIDVGDRRFLVRLHAGGYEVVQAETSLCDPVAEQALEELMVVA